MPVCVASPTCWSIVWLSTAAMPAPASYKKISRHLTNKARTKANKVAKKCTDYTMRALSSFNSKGCNFFFFPKGIFKKQAKRLCARSAARMYSQRRKHHMPTSSGNKPRASSAAAVRDRFEDFSKAFRRSLCSSGGAPGCAISQAARSRL